VTAIHPLILSGGAGTRLWPLSRELQPKQLLPLFGSTTMLQATAQRARRIDGAAPPIVVCNDAHRFMVAEQLRGTGCAPAAILLEPVGRNTAPAVAVGALEAQRTGGDGALLLVMAADHLVRDVAAFAAVVAEAVPAAAAGHLVTFGIVPTHPETGYGYVQAGDPSPAGGFQVRRFVEKPDLDTARGYVARGGHYWNSGMFLLRADTYLDELARHAPPMRAACAAAFERAVRDLDFTRLDADAFAACPADSIDYAVMEKTARAVTFPLAAGWSDVGSWRAVWEEGPADADGNVVAGDAWLDGCHDCYVRADGRIAAVLGLDDVIVVDSKDALLVAAKSRVQDVRRIVERLRAAGRDEVLSHRLVYRPWGSYEGLDRGDRFQVKRITVRPGRSLSLQKHHHRAEHWIVVRGTARVTCGSETRLLTENQSTYIPLGEVHRLENPGRMDLEMIEVQSGSYLGEDDIVRLDDHYGRGGAT
jgi:mannose-1-phosphate guanylyltransferase/mannose-6-phosphate isomerase